MCGIVSLKFCAKNLTKKDVYNKDILEVGSLDVNGSVRHDIEKKDPIKYVGIDMRNGRGVDVVCDACNILDTFGENSFDILVSTMTLEHIEYWKKAIHNFKLIVKPGGIILITVPHVGSGYRPHPDDYWRYTLDDMKNIFSDFTINVLEKHNRLPGVYVKMTKPVDFIENDISNYELYSAEKEKKYFYNRVKKKLRNNKKLLKLETTEKKRIKLKKKIRILERHLRNKK